MCQTAALRGVALERPGRRPDRPVLCEGDLGAVVLFRERHDAHRKYLAIDIRRYVLGTAEEYPRRVRLRDLVPLIATYIV